MNLLSFDATITTEIYRNPKNYFTIAIARINGTSETIVGFFPIFNDGLVIHCHGKKEKGRNKKEQYRVESYSIQLPKTDTTLFRFLTNDYIVTDGEIALTVTDKLGISFLENYKNHAYLKEHLGAKYFDDNKALLLSLENRLDEVKEKLKIMQTLIDMGFANDISAKISFSEFKTTAKSVLENPYQLIFPFDLTWPVVDTIALKNGIGKLSNLRIEEGICFLLEDAVKRNAHIYLPRNELLGKLLKLLQLHLDLPTFKEFEKKLREEKRVYCDVEHHLYGYRYFKAEEQLSKDLYRIDAGEVESDETVNNILKQLDYDEIVYSDEQKEAIFKGLKFPLLIINGPAGTGKTTVLKRIVDLIDSHKNSGKKMSSPDYYKIKLCAPTGRASERMKEVTKREAQTTHSLLLHNQITKLPMYNESNPLDFDCYIVDESSMKDTVLFSELLNAAKKGAKVIIVGDENQLPSIGPGNVLHELLHNSPFEKVTLTRVYRQGAESNILDLATAIRTGDTDVTHLLSKKTKDFTYLPNENPFAMQKLILQTAEMLINKKDFNFYSDFQIITPIHKGPIGTIALNEGIQNLLNKKMGQRKSVTLGNKIFYVGDKVIHTTNNTEKKMFNGEIGKVMAVHGKTLTVEFAGKKMVSYATDELFDLELAFATTVHKMQGSENAIILFPLHLSFGVMLQRKLFYTGATRAKQKLMLMGSYAAIIKAISTDNTEERNCNLKQRLIESRLTHLFT